MREKPWDANKMAAGKCPQCKVRFQWPRKHKIQLKDAYCPICGHGLIATSHLWKGAESNRLPIKGKTHNKFGWCNTR